MEKHGFLLFGIIPLVCFNVFGQLWRDPPVSQTNTKQVNCAECHSSMVEQKIMHAPAQDACDNCHLPNGNDHPQENVKGFDLGEEIPALCFMCHEENTKKNIHPPSEMGECLMCHSPHGSPYRSLLVNSPQSALCAGCHDMGMTEKRVKHKPVADGTCSNCHDPHQSDFSQFLKAEKHQLCMDCHETVKKEAGMENIHYPFDDGCANCHDAHSAEEDNLLNQRMPGLCYNCHDMQSVIESAKVVHKVVSEGKSCANCHSPHASDQGMLLLKNGKDLCLDCHSKTIKTEEGSISNIGQLLRKSKHIHGVIEMDGCVVCHNPHASDQSALLTGSFPEGLYCVATPENFELCFTCHDSELLETEFSSTATNFRNGEQNLHYLHINGNKGRNCNVCHNVHGSVNEHLIRTNVVFGNWKMPIKFKLEENGGSCNTGCHAEKKYLR